jgi:Zn-dependent peptidase ImmA (M78 family)/DNA-binding XRE family transcriptional regulator
MTRSYKKFILIKGRKMYQIVGRKIRKLREAMGLTQEELANSVGLSSEFISLLELGKRAPSLESLSRIAAFFKKEISFFTVEKEESFNFLLKAKEVDKKARQVLKRFKNYSDDYLRLEEVTGRRLDLAPLYTNITAERMAEQERRRLGLGEEPIRNIFPLLELNGLRILRHPLADESKISGVFIFVELKQAAFALLNSTQSFDQQVFIAAHEYGHYLKDRYDDPIIDNPDIFIDEYVSLYHPRERFAQKFAYYFLIPRSKAREVVEKDIGKSRLEYDDVLYLKRYFGVSIQAMLNTLKEMEYISPKRWKEFQKRDSDTWEFALYGNRMGELKKGRRQTIFSERFVNLTLDAFRKKKINKEEVEKLLPSLKGIDYSNR